MENVNENEGNSTNTYTQTSRKKWKINDQINITLYRAVVSVFVDMHSSVLEFAIDTALAQHILHWICVVVCIDEKWVKMEKLFSTISPYMENAESDSRSVHEARIKACRSNSE